MNIATSVLLLGISTSLVCALLGAFLVVRGQAMLTDAMSHGMLPGIVITAWIVGSINSPWLILGAALMGMMVVLVSEAIRQTGIVSADASVGVFYPAMFSLGIIMMSTVFKKIHLHEASVLEGDLNIAAIGHIQIGNIDFGPQYLWVMLALLVLDGVCIWWLWRPLLASSFDPQLALIQGLPVKTINYLFMFLISITITAAFKMAGAVLVLAFFIVPAATARLITQRMRMLIFGSLIVSAFTTTAGFILAYQFELATSATMAAFGALFFIAVFLGTRFHAWQIRGTKSS